MIRSLVRTPIALLSLSLVACGGMVETGVEEFRQAIPSSEQLSLELGEAPVVESTGEIRQQEHALKAQKAGLFVLTAAVVLEINGKLVLSLGLLRSIVDRPPTSVQGDTATWGPYAPALGAVTWMLEVQRTGPGQYRYQLSGRRRAQLTGNFVVVASGTSARGTSSSFSGYSGEVIVESTKLNDLNPLAYRDTGRVRVSYDTTGDQRRVSMELIDFSRKGRTLQNSTYHYLDRVDRSGEFEFAAVQDVHANGSAEESYLITTRWGASRAGRSEASITGGDLPAGKTLSVTECWDSSFTLIYFEDSEGLYPVVGDPTSCLF